MNQLTNLTLKKHAIEKVKILSSGVYFPAQVVKSDDLFIEIRSESQYGIPTNFMSKRIGIEERRMADDSAKPSDLAIPAAQQAIDSCESLNADTIDMIVFCGIERDQPEPATSHTIQNALGLSASHVFDVASACFGFIHGMELASNYIRLGMVDKALVVTGEVPTRILRCVVDELKAGVQLERAKLLIGALTVGDAGGAVILGASPDCGQSGFEAFKNVTDSSHINKCIYKWGHSGVPEGQMEMAGINQAICKMHESLISDTLDSLMLTEFDWVLIHQTGAYPFEQLAKLRGVHRDRIIKTYNRFGNITSATFPANFNLLQKSARIQPGDTIGGLFAGSGLSIGQFVYTY